MGILAKIRAGLFANFGLIKASLAWSSPFRLHIILGNLFQNFVQVIVKIFNSEVGKQGSI